MKKYVLTVTFVLATVLGFSFMVSAQDSINLPTPPPVPTVQASLSPSGSVYLSWSHSAGATSYRLWRLPRWENQDDWRSYESLSTTDFSTMPGMSYQYKVVAVARVGGYDYLSGFSNPVYVTIPNSGTNYPTPTPFPTPTPNTIAPTPTPIPYTSYSPGPTTTYMPTPLPTSLQLARVKVLSGSVTFSDNRPVLDAGVGAYSKDTGEWVNAPVDSTGHYSLNLSGGTWMVKVWPKSSSGWQPSLPVEINFSRDSVSEARTHNVVVASLNSTLYITTMDNSGGFVSGAGVVIDMVSAAQVGITSNSGSAIFAETDFAGRVSRSLKAGTYYVRAFMPDVSGYLNPVEQIVTISQGETKEIKLIFIKKASVTALYLKVTTRLNDGRPVDAYIWAWSEKGRSVTGRSGLDGTFNLQISPDDKWHIGAGRIIDGVPYKAPEVSIPVVTTSVPVELILSAASGTFIAPTATITKTATQEITTTSQDGAKVTVPANTVSTTDSITVEVRPTIEAPSQPSARVIGNAYDILIKNTAGQMLREFSNEVTVEIPYKESDLTAQGLTEDQAAPSYFDDTTGTWVRVDNYTVDKERNVIIARVNHLTLFAVVYAADSTPPSSPTSVRATALGGGQISLSWTTSSPDADYLNIYRSENPSSLGRLEGTTRSLSFLDEFDVKDGVTYYYVVRAVDKAGNEANNTTSVAIRAVGDSSKTLSSSALEDGDMISAAGSSDPDIYIINGLGFKRLFLNPVIFSFYGHLGGFQNVRSISASSRDSYVTSGLFRNCETNDPQVYGVEITGEDAGTLHWINISGSQAVAEDPNFFSKVFCINNNEFNWYSKSSSYTSLSQVPVYLR